MIFEETKYSPNIKILKNWRYIGTISEKLVHLTMTSLDVDELKQIFCKIDTSSDVCQWKRDEEGVWWTGCGKGFDVPYSTPEGNGMLFCPMCGNKLQEMKGGEE